VALIRAKEKRATEILHRLDADAANGPGDKLADLVRPRTIPWRNGSSAEKPTGPGLHNVTSKGDGVVPGTGYAGYTDHEFETSSWFG
jgi:hypothetical protein